MSQGYLDLKYKPQSNDLVCLFYVEPAEGVSLAKAANHVAGESSIGTWTEVSTMKDDIWGKLRPSIYSLDEENKLVKIAYPLELFEPENIAQILSSVAGNIYGMKALENLRLLDVGFPSKMIKKHAGPRFGIQGVRDVVEVRERPLVGTIVKPKVGLPPREHANVAYEAWVGGCDVVKDDENLTSQGFNKFKDRITETLGARDKAEGDSGETKVYMPNVTAETYEMLERIDYVKDHGGRYAMVDVVTLGFSAVQSVRQKDYGVVLHAHRAMHAALTRNPRHGITMLALAKLLRLVGVDQLHIGTAVGKMQGPKEEVYSISQAITQKKVEEKQDRLPQLWGQVKPVFPVCSGGLHPGHVPELMGFMGQDIIIQAGGGIHGHPEGTRQGAEAMRAAIEATLENQSLHQWGEKHKPLELALRKFK
ncbi:MAG: type III ribulose-bisphosphate carboxylase [Candidatus Altiarchaeales archaeon]|nr:type III ribulose-bisphosphate carboxylase [Candidatus Altiarchaeales archaeon]